VIQHYNTAHPRFVRCINTICISDTICNHTVLSRYILVDNVYLENTYLLTYPRPGLYILIGVLLLLVTYLE
jgi:hypothetical protein